METFPSYRGNVGIKEDPDAEQCQKLNHLPVFAPNFLCWTRVVQAFIPALRG